MADRYVAINDHWINDTREFIRQGEVREFGKDGTGGNPHFVKIPQGIRDDRDINSFVQSESSRYAAERREREMKYKRKISVQVPAEIR